MEQKNMKLKFNTFVEDFRTERYVEFMLIAESGEIIQTKKFIVEEKTGGDDLWNFVCECMYPYTTNVGLMESPEQYATRFFDKIYSIISKTEWYEELYQKEYNALEWIYFKNQR